MAQITYANKVALNENPEVAAINKVRDVDMNEIKTVINENENKQLIAVSSTAPAQCSTGDMYFNTSTKLIYTATGTNTWGSTGVAPTSNTIYIDLTNQTLYTYDGDTLISVGGGSGSSDIVIVAPDTPTQDTKLYIEASDLEPQYSAITDEYSTANNLAYSCDYINGVELYNDNTGTTGTVNLSDSISNYSYLEIYYKNSNSFTYSTKIPTDYTSFTISAIWAGSDGSSYFASCVKSMSGSSISTDGARYGTSYITLGGTMGGQQTNALNITRVIGYK